jgi:predicted dehydrogenase
METVAIGSPYGDRGQMAIQALEAGKNVICDKPLCTSLEELDKIERLAKEKGLFVSCMFTMRYEEKIAAVKAAIDEGKIGKIHNVYFGGQHPLQYGRRPFWYFEKGKHGGVINDIAIHGIDLLSYMCHLEVEQINAARCWNAYATEEKDFQDSAQFMLTATNGAGIISDVSYAIPNGVEFALPYYWQFYIWGEKGTISFSMNTEAVLFEQGNPEKQVLENKKAENYLTDFYRLVNGEKKVVLPMEEVFKSTRLTLKTQRVADER